ncbi:hypothetical protein Bpfe_006591, partial [Biomphalaria pfeifferi]
MQQSKSPLSSLLAWAHTHKNVSNVNRVVITSHISSKIHGWIGPVDDHKPCPS